MLWIWDFTGSKPENWRALLSSVKSKKTKPPIFCYLKAAFHDVTVGCSRQKLTIVRETWSLVITPQQEVRDCFWTPETSCIKIPPLGVTVAMTHMCKPTIWNTSWKGVKHTGQRASVKIKCLKKMYAKAKWLHLYINCAGCCVTITGWVSWQMFLSNATYKLGATQAKS